MIITKKKGQGSYEIYKDKNLIGRVRLLWRTSGSACEWKAEGIAFVYNQRNFQSRQQATDNLVRAYDKR